MNLTEDSSKKKNPHPSLPAKSPGHNATRPVVALYSRYLYSVSSLFISENIFLSIKWKKKNTSMLVALEEIADANPNALSLLLFLNDFTAIILVLCPILKNKILVYLACGTCKMFVVVSTSLVSITSRKLSRS